MNLELLGREEEGEDGGAEERRAKSQVGPITGKHVSSVSRSVGKLAKRRSLLQSMMTRRKDRRRYSLEVSGESDSPCPEIDAHTFLARSRGTIHKGRPHGGGG